MPIRLFETMGRRAAGFRHLLMPLDEAISSRMSPSFVFDPSNPELGSPKTQRGLDGGNDIEPSHLVFRGLRGKLDKEVLFEEGLKIRGEHDNLKKHVQGNPGKYISGTPVEMSAKAFTGISGVILVKNRPEIGVNVKRTFVEEQAPDTFSGEDVNYASREAEIAACGDIPSEDIKAARKFSGSIITAKSSGIYHGQIHENPNYVYRNWSIEVASIDEIEAQLLEIEMRQYGDLGNDERVITYSEAKAIAAELKQNKRVLVEGEAPNIIYHTVPASMSPDECIAFVVNDYNNKMDALGYELEGVESGSSYEDVVGMLKSVAKEASESIVCEPKKKTAPSVWVDKHPRMMQAVPSDQVDNRSHMETPWLSADELFDTIQSNGSSALVDQSFWANNKAREEEEEEQHAPSAPRIVRKA